MSPDRREKITALLDSPVAGEREAAQAALGRLEPADPKIPASGSKEWHEARIAWAAKIQFCVGRLGSPLLTSSDVVTVRNWSRGIGSPWEAGAEKLEAVYRKLGAGEPATKQLQAG